jgi:hypothetical protein
MFGRRKDTAENVHLRNQLKTLSDELVKSHAQVQALKDALAGRQASDKRKGEGLSGERSPDEIASDASASVGAEAAMDAALLGELRRLRGELRRVSEANEAARGELATTKDLLGARDRQIDALKRHSAEEPAAVVVAEEGLLAADDEWIERVVIASQASPFVLSSDGPAVSKRLSMGEGRLKGMASGVSALAASVQSFATAVKGLERAASALAGAASASKYEVWSQGDEAVQGALECVVNGFRGFEGCAAALSSAMEVSVAGPLEDVSKKRLLGAAKACHQALSSGEAASSAESRYVATPLAGSEAVARTREAEASKAFAEDAISRVECARLSDAAAIERRVALVERSHAALFALRSFGAQLASSVAKASEGRAFSRLFASLPRARELATAREASWVRVSSTLRVRLGTALAGGGKSEGASLGDLGSGTTLSAVERALAATLTDAAELLPSIPNGAGSVGPAAEASPGMVEAVQTAVKRREGVRRWGMSRLGRHVGGPRSAGGEEEDSRTPPRTDTVVVEEPSRPRDEDEDEDEDVLLSPVTPSTEPPPPEAMAEATPSARGVTSPIAGLRDGVVYSGWLYKKSSGSMSMGMRRDWKRRWFFVRGGRLWYVRSAEDLQPREVASLVVCNVREGPKEAGSEGSVGVGVTRATGEGGEVEAELSNVRHGFSLRTPGRRVWVLQAPSQRQADEWVRVLRRYAERLLVSGGRASIAAGGVLEELRRGALAEASRLRARERREKRGPTVEEESDEDLEVSDEDLGDEGEEADVTPGDVPSDPRLARLQERNPRCADCGAPRPDWASLNLGVLLCIGCSGVHRGMGVKVSKVRSLVLDSISPEEVGVLEAIGNETANSYWQSSLPEGWVPLRPASRREERERFIHAKYVWRGFTTPDPAVFGIAPPPENPSSAEPQSVRAARSQEGLQRLLSEEMVRRAREGDTRSVAQLLAWGASVAFTDESGESALGASRGHGAVETLLLLNNALGDAP